MKIGVIIQARMSSTRLPGKVMLTLCNKPVLFHDIKRIKESKYNPLIIIATTTKSIDDVIVDFCIENGVKYFRGSEEDVLSRYYLAAKENNIDIVVRITSDCPLYESRILDEMLTIFKKSDLDYLSNVNPIRTFPRGLDTEIFSFRALERAYNEALDISCREHVTPYIYMNPEEFKIGSFKDNLDNSHLRWTLDTEEDYELIKSIYDYIYVRKNNFSYEDILEAYKDNPEWKYINNKIEQKKVGYKGI